MPSFRIKRHEYLTNDRNLPHLGPFYSKMAFLKSRNEHLAQLEFGRIHPFL
jgi:hypothetical protein